MPAWLIPALIGGATATVGAALTRRDAKKETARVAEANKKEAARVQAENKKEAARVEALRKSEQKEAIKENTQVRENYYKNVVADAQAAGINPLTALRTGAGASYGTAVAGTIRTPVMRDGVYLEGVYQTPTLSRNPIAAGMEAATNIGLAQMTRRKQESHDVRMAELRGRINRANSLAIQGFTGSPDGKLPPRDQWWRYVKNSDGSLKIDDQGYAVERVALTSEPLTRNWRLGNFSYVGHNPEAFESSLGEMVGSGKAHVAAGLPQGVADYIRGVKEQVDAPMSRNNFQNPNWSNEWRHHVNDALK